MRKQYKNKRDFYKAEAEFWKNAAKEKQEKINELTKPKPEERVKCAWFCPNCRKVFSGTKGKSFNLEGSRCRDCGHLGCMAVSKLPFNF